MGLDQYLFSASKDKYRKHKAIAKTIEKCNKKLDKMFVTKYQKAFEELPRLSTYEIDVENLTDEQNRLFKEYEKEESTIAKSFKLKFNEYHELVEADVDENESCARFHNFAHEIHYWRKNWILHDIIIKTCGDPENDNCVDIILTKKSIKTIIRELKKKPSNADGWYDGMYDDAIRVFREALHLMDDKDSVIFYHPWY